MKKIVLSVLIACFAFLNTNAQENKNGPKIEFTKDVHDYGTIENGADGTCEFKFKNTGKEDLLITNCRASCGCTIPAWPREAIKKGKTGVIKVKYDTKRTGAINKTITITSNAVNTPSKVVRIAGKINPPKAKAPIAKAPVNAQKAARDAKQAAFEANQAKEEQLAKAATAAKLAQAKKTEEAAQTQRDLELGRTGQTRKATKVVKETTTKKRRWFQFWKKKN